jgi:polyvinyl alcohol dehydrogenase (cytochrome)
MRFVLVVAASACAAGALATPLFAQAPDGAAVFQRECATCHVNPGTDSRAPTREALRQFYPDAIVTALTTGAMRVQGEKLSEAERRAVAQFLTDTKAGPAPTVITTGKCATPGSVSDPARGQHWNGWGAGVTNTRFQTKEQGGLTAADVPKLTLKWAFGLPDVVAARSQPAVAGGRLYTASEKGDVFALNAKTGCLYWVFRAQAGVRTAITVGPYKARTGTRYAVYFGDGRANAYAVDAETGEQLWVRKVDDHPGATLTGAPTLYEGRLYVPMSGLNEEAQGGQSKYECCTFRGSVTAIDATTGAIVWKSYSIPEEPKPRGKNKDGVQMWGPAGGGVWAAPTIDAKRGAIYISTGNGYADPPQRTTNAVVALDLKTGKIKWVNQATPNDIWTMGCRPENPDNPNCPAKLGPDFDFSASPALTRLSNGRELIIIPQKSGVAYALDPDKEGALVWQYRFGQGSGFGGQWGAAADGQQAYFGVGDFFSPQPGGMHAVRLDTGQRVWSMPPQPKLCGDAQRCNGSQGGAVTAVPGVVFSGSGDGGLRAYSTTDGSIIWQFDTNRTFQTVNGVRANGGTMDGPGPVVAGGMLYVNSGYGGFFGRSGNVLLAFGVD